MDTCICNTTALEVYRSYGRLLPTLLECPRTSKLDSCGLPSPQMLDDLAVKIGARSKPYHLAFGSPSQAKARHDIRRHVYAATLPRRSLIRLDRSTLIVSPEFLFVELCARRDLDEMDLALIGFELCGTYVIDPDEGSWSGLISHGAALTSKKKIARMAGNLASRPGSGRARRALELFEDASNSPMETVLALLFVLPRRLGGLGLGPATMNKQVATSTGSRWVDLVFASSSVGLEYKGKKPHSIEKTARDDRRQNKLTSSGITILNVWYEDLRDAHLFEQLVSDVTRTLGVRVRIRSAAFAQRQNALRVRLMPAIQRYGDFVA